MPDILFYHDDKTRLRTLHLKAALERDIQLPDMDVHYADRHGFRAAIENKPDAIFIAENIGPQSHHMRDISKKAIKAMQDYAYNGGTLVFFGGASHYAMSDITWHWDNGTSVYKGAKETFTLVHGEIIGPHQRFPLSPDDAIDHNGCFEVPLFVQEASNQIAVERCWQGNCGDFIINEDRVHYGYEVLARYAHKKGVAALNIPLGKKGGNIILCSTMPHYNFRYKSPLWNKILTRIESKITGFQNQKMLKRVL